MSPATPSTHDHAVDTSSTSCGNSGLHSARSTQIDPSPASTYGSSAASDSDADVPPTPDNDGTYNCFFLFTF
jgi:hypothetical protein